MFMDHIVLKVLQLREERNVLALPRPFRSSGVLKVGYPVVL